MIAELDEFMAKPPKRSEAAEDERSIEGPRKDAQADAGASSDAAETPRGNEGGQEAPQENKNQT